jgi:cellulose synthase (UDP-forming)
MSGTIVQQRRGRWIGVNRTPLGLRLLYTLIALVGVLLVVAVATVPLTPRQQAILAVSSAAIFLIANRFRGRDVSVFLVMLSLAISLRYIVWRMTSTLSFPTIAEMIVGSILVIAEFYAITVLVLGYVQTIWPLERKPVPLPDDVSTWPTVDVFIPTYNEAMSIVRATVFGCIAMDWPKDKMRVWLLDDGRREEFRQFAASVGIGYITRTNNAHAKAGNLNNAMAQTSGEYIAVFDCDHIPTRAFLQMTMGMMMQDPRVALVQTPHHFYSPDPFQRNLAAGTRVPPEGNMFYGLVQDGNDYWNATFFCGSCALLRRTAIEEIGGFAVETVTEDAHTMLKMHRRGWDSAYLRMPLAAGLATERLILHIGQRMRWARGMIQISRIDNPLFGPGLTVGQRICYLQAMGHFFFAIPRLIFLCAPLMYLLLGQNIIAASPLAIIAYALPHIFHSVATNSRLQKNWRHSFWSEIYETVLALFLVRVTIVTLFAPRRGKFNVTAKGGLLENGYFDLGAVYPNIFLAFLLIAGVIRGLVQLILVQNPVLIFQALLLNSIWALFSLLTVMAALAVGRETRQIRSNARLRAVVPVVIYLPDGRLVTGTTRDLSQGGGSVAVERPDGVANGIMVEIEFTLGTEPLLVPARVLRWEQRFMQVTFQPQTLAEEAHVVRAVFGRADAWTDWAAYPEDRPLASLWRVLVSIRGLFRPRDRAPAPAAALIDGNGNPAPTMLETANIAVAAPARQAAGTAAALLLAVGLSLLMPGIAHAQLPGAQGNVTVRPVPAPVMPVQTEIPALSDAVPPPPTGQGIAGGAMPTLADPGNQPALPEALNAGGATGGATTSAAALAGDAVAPQTRKLVLSLRQLGAIGPLTLRGTSELQGVQFGIRSDEVVIDAVLTLSGAMSPTLIPQYSNVTVTLNEQYVGTIPVVPGQPQFNNLVMPVSPVFFQDNNRLNFRFSGRYTVDCNDPLSTLLWSTLSDTSTLTLTLQRLPPQRDLARLPLPFFDNHESQRLLLPVVVPQAPSNQALQAAGVVSSWFGQLADFRGANFPVVSVAPTEGNAVVIGTQQDLPPGLALPPINGPTVAEIANPNDASASLLVVTGRTGDELVAAASSLALGSRTLGGQMATVAAPDMPPRKPYDAPYWVPTDRPVKFGELVDSADLQGVGYVPGTMRVPFRTAPDLYTWRNQGFPVHVNFRAPPGPILDLAVSRLDAGINDVYLSSFPLAQHPGTSWLMRLFQPGSTVSSGRFDVPVYDVFGQNDLQFFFDTRPLHRGACTAVPSDVRESIDPDSTIDLSGAYHFAQLPNLAYFVNSGFPFTRMADFSNTAVVLPSQPGALEISAYLDMMARIGSLTGYPVIRVAVVRPDEVNTVADRNLLVMGTLAQLQNGADLLKNSPFRLDGNRLDLQLGGRLQAVSWLFDDEGEQQREQAAALLSTPMTSDMGVLVGEESPLQSGRSLVAILASAPQGLVNAVNIMRDSAQAPLIQGDLAIISDGRASSYRVGDTFTVGSLAPWMWPSWYLRDSPIGILGVMIVGCVLIGLVFHWALRRRASNRMSRTVRS